ncbi:hypothetical protein NDU88_002267, partial [Pleurodeles waltl]
HMYLKQCSSNEEKKCLIWRRLHIHIYIGFSTTRWLFHLTKSKWKKIIIAKASLMYKKKSVRIGDYYKETVLTW